MDFDKIEKEVSEKVPLYEALSFSKLWKTLKSLGTDIKQKDLKNWYFKNTQNERTTKQKVVYDPVIATEESDNTWQIDLFFIERKYWVKNKNTRILLTKIDLYSRKVDVVGLTKKDADNIVKALNHLFKDNIPQKIQTDEGSEWINKKVQQLFKEKGIDHFIQASVPGTNNIHIPTLESFHRNLRGMIERLIQNNDGNFIDKLHLAIKQYNNTIHSSLKATPNQVYNYEKFYEQKQPIKKLPIGTKVRKIVDKALFDKGTQKWSSTIHTITGYDGLKYILDKDNSILYFRREIKPTVLDAQSKKQKQEISKQKNEEQKQNKIIKTQRRMAKDFSKKDLEHEIEHIDEKTGKPIFKDRLQPQNKKRVRKPLKKLDL